MDISVNLDINKAGQFINDPVTMRVGETDNVIKATIFKDNKSFTDFKTATFNTTRLDGTVIANDPATVSGNIVSYSVAPAVTSGVGKLRNSYFLLDGKTSTESFEVAILSGVSKSGEVTDFIPGFQELQDKLEKVNSGMNDKLDGINKEVNTFLANVQAEIDDKNSKFTDDQKTQITSALNDLKAQIATNKSDVTNIANQISDISNSVNKFQDGMSVGTRNLLIGTEKFIGNSNLDYDTDGTPILTNAKYTDTGNFTKDAFIQKLPIASDKNYYTVSFYAKADNDGDKINNFLYMPNTVTKVTANYGISGLSADGNMTLNLSTEWRKYWIKWTQTPTGEAKTIILGRTQTNLNNKGPVHIKLPILVEGTNIPDWHPAPEDKLSISDTTNYQKNKITNDDGGRAISINKGDTSTQDQTFIKARGVKAFYVQAGAEGNDTGYSLRGILNMPDDGYGYAIGVNNMQKVYYKSIIGSVAYPWQELATVPSTTPVAAMAYTAMLQDDTNSKLQAQNSQIAYSLMTQGDTTNAK